MATVSKKKKYLKKIEKKHADFSKDAIANADERVQKRYSLVNMLIGVLLIVLSLCAIISILGPFIDLGFKFGDHASTIKGYELIAGVSGEYMAENAYQMFTTNVLLIVIFVLPIIAGVLSTIFKGQLWVKIVTALLFVVSAIGLFLIVPISMTSATTQFLDSYKTFEAANFCKAPYWIGTGYLLCSFIAFFKDDVAKMTIKNII